MSEMRTWEKKIETSFRPPSFFKPTLNEALLMTIVGVSLFAWQKPPLSLSRRVLKAALIPSAFFGVYKRWEIKKWQDGRKGELLSRKDLKLDELDKLPPEERAFLIREDFFGTISYANFLECHGVEKLEKLFSEREDLGYRDCLKQKFLDAIKDATTLEELLKVSSFPSLSVSLEEYREALPQSLGAKLNKGVWTHLEENPNYDVLRLLIDANIKHNRDQVTVSPVWNWLNKFGFAEKVCLEFVYSGKTDIQVLFQKEVWKFIGDGNNLSNMLTIPCFKSSGSLKEINASQHGWKSEDITKLIQSFNLEINSDDLHTSPLMEAILNRDIPLVNALVCCGATVLDEHIKEVIDRNSVLLIEEFKSNKGFDLNRNMTPYGKTGVEMSPIVYAIIEKKEQVAQWLWKQPDLKKNIRWQNHDNLEGLAKFYAVDLTKK